MDLQCSSLDQLNVSMPAHETTYSLYNFPYSIESRSSYGRTLATTGLKIFLVAYLFLFIYTPRFRLAFGIGHILNAIALIFLFTTYLDTAFRVLNKSKLKIFIILQCVLTIYSLIMGDLIFTYHIAYTLLEVLPCIIFISIICVRCKFDIYKLYDLILLVGIIQVVFVILSMLFPEFRNWIVSNAETNEFENLYSAVSLFRIYGWAMGYTSSMPRFQGLCVIIAYALGVFKSPKYFLLIPLFLLSILVNARSAIISVFIVSIIIILIKFRTRPLRQVFNIIFIVLLCYLFVYIVKYKAESSTSLDAWVWVYDAIEQTVDFVKYGEVASKTNLGHLTETMWFMPKGLGEFLVGSGVDAYSTGRSDIGYMIYLHYGGIIFSSILYLSYIFLIKKSITKEIINKTIYISVLFYLFIMNLKCSSFNPDALVKGVLVLIVFSITAEYYQKKLFIIKRINNKSWLKN